MLLIEAVLANNGCPIELEGQELFIVIVHWVVITAHSSCVYLTKFIYWRKESGCFDDKERKRELLPEGTLVKVVCSNCFEWRLENKTMPSEKVPLVQWVYRYFFGLGYR
jgi:hypothetical protein